jgi:cobalamin biosynthesis protein CobT
MSKAEEFIIDSTKNYSNEKRITIGKLSHWEKQPWLTPDDARKAVEIAREEITEKACEYLDGLIEILNDHGHKLNKERIIGGLKQAMKNE